MGQSHAGRGTRLGQVLQDNTRYCMRLGLVAFGHVGHGAGLALTSVQHLKQHAQPYSIVWPCGSRTQSRPRHLSPRWYE